MANLTAHDDILGARDSRSRLAGAQRAPGKTLGRPA